MIGYVFLLFEDMTKWVFFLTIVVIFFYHHENLILRIGKPLRLSHSALKY